jgi:hypothetical protein
MKIQALLRLKILASQASSKEPVGPALGQLGIPIMDFCTKFNGLTQKYFNDTPLNVVVYSYGSQKYDFIIKFPDFSFFIKRCFIGYIKCKKPGYLTLPMDKLFYLTPFILYEVLLYYSSNLHNNLIVYFKDYKKLSHSLRSNGFIVFSN